MGKEEVMETDKSTDKWIIIHFIRLYAFNYSISPVFLIKIYELLMISRFTKSTPFRAS